MIAKLGCMLFHRMVFSTWEAIQLIDNKEFGVNSNFSTWKNIIAGVPQGSVLGPLLFNIFINFLFLFVSNSYLRNYADDNTLYAYGYNLEEIKNTLRFDFDLVSRWFEENYMVLDTDKCHFRCLGYLQ